MILKRSWIFHAIVLVAATCASASGQTRRRLDTTTFIVMGEGLAAGMANYGLSAVGQQYSFPAQMAAQMNTGFEQPLIQPPGIGDVVGYPAQEVRLQAYPQGSVRRFYLPTDTTKDPIQAPPLFVTNLSVPGLTLKDSTVMRPVAPIVQRNAKQTVFNMILGFPQLILDNVPLWTQLEYAENMFPTMVLVELGYYEALDAAVNGDPSRMPDPKTFAATYNSVLAGLRAQQAEVIATTIPNPIDTAYFNSLTAAAAATPTSPAVLAELFSIQPQDYVTRNGMLAIGAEFLEGALSPLPSGSVLPAAVAADLTARVNALNAQIAAAATANGAVLYDLNAFLHKIKVSGVTVGGSTVGATFPGGFYSLDAVYPSPTGHALIANDILAFLNQTYQQSFPMINVSKIAANDPNLVIAKPGSAPHTMESFRIPTRRTNR